MDLEHEKRLSKVESRSESNTHRIDELEKRQDNLDDLVSTVKVLALREESVENDVKEIKADVKNLTSKPARVFEDLKEKILYLIVAAVMGFLLAKLGL